MQTAGPNHRHRNRRWSMIRHSALPVSRKYQFAFKSKCMLPPPPSCQPLNEKIFKKLSARRRSEPGLSAIRLSFTRDSGVWPGCGAGTMGGAAGARRAEFTPVKRANAEAVGMVILAIWPVAKSAIEVRLCTDLEGKCPPGIKLFGQGSRPDQPNRGKNRRRRPRASVSRSRAGGKAILPVFAPGEADYPAGLAPLTPQSYQAHLHATRALETTADPDRKAELEKALLSKEQQAALARIKVESLAPPEVRPCRAHQTRPGITPAFLPLRRPFSVPYQQAHERDGQLPQAS